MIDIPLRLKLQKPQIAKFLTDWSKANERTFDFSAEKDKEEFVAAMMALAGSIAQTNKKAAASLVVNDDGVELVYLRLQ